MVSITRVSAFWVLIFLTLPIFHGYSQKKISYDQPAWPLSHENVAISPDGNYVTYGDSVLILAHIPTGKKYFFKGATRPGFDIKSRLMVAHLYDQVCVVNLKTGANEIVPEVNDFELAPIFNDWILCKDKDGIPVALYNCLNSNRLPLSNLTAFHFSADGRFFVFTATNNGRSRLTTVDLISGKIQNKNLESAVKTLIGDRLGKYLVMIGANQKLSESWFDIWDIKQQKNILHLDSASLLNGLRSFTVELILPTLEFDTYSENLLLTLQLRNNNKPHPFLTLWSYQDESLKPYLLKENSEIKFSRLSANLRTGQLNLVSGPDEDILTSFATSKGYLIVRNKVNGFETFWKGKPVCFLVNCKTGERRLFVEHTGSTSSYQDNFAFSPEGNTIVYFDEAKQKYLSYNIRSGINQILAANEHTNFGQLESWQTLSGRKKAYGIAGFSEDSKSVYVYSKYDIFELGLTGTNSTKCITNYEGLKSSTELRFLSNHQEGIYEGKQILSAFQRTTKKSGFYEIDLNKSNPPIKLILDQAYFGVQEIGTYSLFGGEIPKPKKASFANAYLLYRMTADQYPVLTYTRDFHRFKNIYTRSPNKQYNWLKSELYTWRDKQGELYQGVLYKPQDFDAHKKYPVVFYIYEQLSDLLHVFPQPGVSAGPLNIPYYVSDGYLVLMVDIHYDNGDPAHSIFESVESAADDLAKKPWADANAFGIQGHSFGGYEVNTIIARTDRFAAACSAAGVSDLVGFYAGLQYGIQSGHSHLEEGQLRLGKTIWENPQAFVDNSPVFHTEKIHTPLLLQNNRNDGNVNWINGVELFTSLRRQGKPVWLLEYKESDHTLGGDEAKDFTVRMKQFFDHYLKRTPLPSWMSGG